MATSNSFPPLCCLSDGYDSKTIKTRLWLCVTKQHNQIMRGGEEELRSPERFGARIWDTLHVEAADLKLNQLLSIRAQEGGGGGWTRTQSVSRHMVQSGQFDAARRLRNAR